MNELFRPSDDDLAHARGVMRAPAEASAAGDGAVAFGGQTIDPPVVERARRTLKLAGESP